MFDVTGLAMLGRCCASRPFRAGVRLLPKAVIAAEGSGGERRPVLRKKRDILGAGHGQEESRRQTIAADESFDWPVPSRPGPPRLCRVARRWTSFGAPRLLRANRGRCEMPSANRPRVTVMRREPDATSIREASASAAFVRAASGPIRDPRPSSEYAFAQAASSATTRDEWLPRVLAGAGVGFGHRHRLRHHALERHRPDPRRVARHERLRDPSAVGRSIQIHLRVAESAEDFVEIVSGDCGRVETKIGTLLEPRSTRANGARTQHVVVEGSRACRAGRAPGT